MTIAGESYNVRAYSWVDQLLLDRFVRPPVLVETGSLAPGRRPAGSTAGDAHQLRPGVVLVLHTAGRHTAEHRPTAPPPLP